ncbi:ornithine decarboxylase-like [Amphibalanus amphitrite]|uniref:ornithine decarboxylase-like n=1 Tax=Amphibalanus amphitrite TaxID=1232801 RepID=UPI001C924EAC|nr:ornithine decarboxylase-like [Amphibalanus amphitrite]
MKQNSPQQTAEVMVVDSPTMSPAVCQQLVSKISRETEDAFYLFDVDDVILKYNTWLEKLPRVLPFYAVKCNNHPILLQVLKALGAGFDCASKAEIQTMTEMGVPPEQIIFANPCKPASHLRYAVARDVQLMTFDNETELTKVQTLAPNARLVLRIRVDAEDAQCPLGIKFGAVPSAAPRLLKLAAAQGLNVVGVSFHVGSGCREFAVYERAIRAARLVFDQAAEVGYTLSLLDLGGGFAGERGSSLDEAAGYINSALDECFPESQGVTVIAEPGRYMAASAFTLATQVTSVRRAADSVDYYVNDGVYGAFNCILYDHLVCVPRPLEEAPAESIPATVWGPTCDSMDRICEGCLLPPLEPQSWLVWENMGAYTLSAAGTFNGFPRATVYPVITAKLSEAVRNAVWPLTPMPEPAIQITPLPVEQCVAEN